MALYFVQHKHPVETCPAQDPVGGAMLLSHINSLNARQYGVNIVGEAVLDGQHTLVLIVETDDRAKIESFMQPFFQAGTVEIHPASTCEVVVDRSGC